MGAAWISALRLRQDASISASRRAWSSGTRWPLSVTCSTGAGAAAAAAAASAAFFCSARSWVRRGRGSKEGAGGRGAWGGRGGKVGGGGLFKKKKKRHRR